MRKTLVLLALILALPAHAAPVPLNPYWGVIFPAERAAALTRQCSRTAPRPEGVWQPQPSDIARLEPGLAKLLTDAKVQPGAYYRQYGGLTVGGRHIIYVNGVRNAVAGADWKSRAISICDGGALAFGVEYDVAGGTFAHFAFNGQL